MRNKYRKGNHKTVYERVENMKIKHKMEGQSEDEYS